MRLSPLEITCSLSHTSFYLILVPLTWNVKISLLLKELVWKQGGFKLDLNLQVPTSLMSPEMYSTYVPWIIKHTQLGNMLYNLYLSCTIWGQ